MSVLADMASVMFSVQESRAEGT